ncbi:hypothetical protein C8J57DRAFT_1243627 [Mycena rebaudengoi]|nr:hypothetical protein C8J57DRAFT_1243627 [Mycena rebaudengoi]
MTSFWNGLLPLERDPPMVRYYVVNYPVFDSTEFKFDVCGYTPASPHDDATDSTPDSRAVSPSQRTEEKCLGRAEIVEFSLQILLRPAVPARRSSTSDSLHVEVNELSDLLGNSEPLLYQSDPELMPHLGLIPAAGKHSGFFKIYKYIDYKICHGAFELLFYHFEKIATAYDFHGGDHKFLLPAVTGQNGV